MFTVYKLCTYNYYQIKNIHSCREFKSIKVFQLVSFFLFITKLKVVEVSPAGKPTVAEILWQFFCENMKSRLSALELEELEFGGKCLVLGYIHPIFIIQI